VKMATNLATMVAVLDVNLKQDGHLLLIPLQPSIRLFPSIMTDYEYQERDVMQASYQDVS